MTGQEIIDFIIQNNLIGGAHHDEEGTVFVWIGNAADQLDAFIQDHDSSRTTGYPNL